MSDRRRLNEIYRLLKELPEDEKLMKEKSVYLTRLQEERHELKMLESIRAQGMEEDQREEMGRFLVAQGILIERSDSD